MRPRSRDSLALGLVILLLLVLSVLPVANDDPIADAIQDAGHVPCFGILALLVWRTLWPWLRARGLTRWQAELLVLALSGGVGLVMEALQIRSERQADLLDLWHDLAGAAAFLLLLRAAQSSRQFWRWIKVLGALALLALALWPFGLTLQHRWQRNAAFPLLCDPASAWGRSLLAVRHGVHWFPAGEAYPDRIAIRLEAQQHAALLVRRPAPDWRGYDQLVLDLVYGERDSFELELRIDDMAHRGEASDRFYRAFTIHPGQQALRVALADIAAAPARREMDLGSMRSVALFIEQGVGPRILYVGAMRLSKLSASPSDSTGP